VERTEAEAILDGDREKAIGLLLRLDELVLANERLVAANERLEERAAELERRLNRSSGNSSLPPSQDPPSAPRPRGKGSGRKRGGQEGHKGPGTGGYFHPSGSTRLLSIGRCGAGRARTSSPGLSASMRRSLLAVRSLSCRRSRCG
jgi:transposase